MLNQELYRTLYTIRRFEETVLENFPKGVFYGTTHTYLGQEANAGGVLSHLQRDDIVFSNHRCHGHFLAYGGDPRALFAEMMGKSTGVCGGRGGSQHLQWRNFYSNGVQGGIVPIATGMALAEKCKGTSAITVCFLGDGTLGEGVVYESLNLASLWDAPILYVVENNHIAQTTPQELAIAGRILSRFAAFDIPVVELDTSDVLEISETAQKLVDGIRQDGAPRGLILNTCRFGPHSKGDDTREPEVVASLRETRDPLKIHAPTLALGERQTIENEVDAQIEAAFQQALDDPFPILGVDDEIQSTTGFPSRHASLPTHSVSVLSSLNTALHQVMEVDGSVILLGEDLLDPYGGAFKVTRGLSDDFPNRVWTTPISEAGIVGVAAGMALRGLRPVVEIMFGDFVTLIADQIVNHIAKFRWMYNDQVRVPLVIRTPMGGRRGYGPTHSQTLEKLYLGVPGLKVVAPCALGDPGELLRQVILEEDDPVLFVENKLLYLETVKSASSLTEFEVIPTQNGFRLSVKGAPPATLSLAAYGYMAELAREAVLRLAYEDEIFADLVVVTQLSPFILKPVFDSVHETGKLLVLEEGTLTLGWGAEVIAQAAAELGSGLKSARRVAARDLPVPSSGILENDVLPGVPDILNRARSMCS